MDVRAQADLGWQFEGHVVVLGADSDNVYLGRSSPSLKLNQAMAKDWRVWVAPRMGGEAVDSRLQPRMEPAWAAALDHIQHVSIHPSGSLAVFSAVRLGGDLDLFLSHRLNEQGPSEEGAWSTPMPLDGLNSEFDEVFPHWEGRDLVFSTNRTGTFVLHSAEASKQWLRSAPMAHTWTGGGDVLSFVTVGPNWTWLSRREPGSEFVRVERVAWPPVEDQISEGWTLCMSSEGRNPAAGSIVVRDPNSRNVVRSLPVDDSGCISLTGLPANQTWRFQWQPDPTILVGTNMVVMEVRSPEGNVVRTYRVEASNGWEFVFLPLDEVAELTMNPNSDESQWPMLTEFVLWFDLGSPTPSAKSVTEFEAWSRFAQPKRSAGHWNITGHTDSSGTPAQNAQLSLNRARHVAGQLSRSWNWPSSAFVVEGRGSSEPLGLDPAQNRRVEVRWVPTMQ